MSERESEEENKKEVEAKRLMAGRHLRARMRLLVCFLTLPVYVIAVWVLLNNNRDVSSLMWAYMALYGVFAFDMVRRRCPNCGEQFFVKSILLNLISKRCVHCGQKAAS